VYSDDVENSRGLTPPQIPDIGDYFDVHVTMAANPSNFTVIVFQFFLSLSECMHCINIYYKLDGHGST
jgi:hypothetical protein